MIVVGIDPGSEGAIVALRDLEPLGWWPLPWVVGEGVEVGGLVATLEAIGQYGPYRVVVESSGYQIGASGGSGARTAYSTGHTLGCLRGALHALRISHERVAPQTWQRDLGVAAPRAPGPVRPAEDATAAQVREYRRALASRRNEARKAGQARQTAYVRARLPTLVLEPGRRVKPHLGVVAGACLALWGQR